VNTKDTLAGISIKYNSNVEDIKRANGIFNESDIWLHTKLKIPIMKAADGDWKIPTEQNQAEV
jgi:LysM repeat protein